MRTMFATVVAAGLFSLPVFAQDRDAVSSAPSAEPLTVYAPLAPESDVEKINQGGVNFDLTVRYMSDYVYRGVDRSEVGGSEDAPNWQFDGQIKFDLGHLPHPFVGLFANVYDSDPASRFQEVRPYFGAELQIKPFTFVGGYTAYIYPERDDITTGEVWGRIIFDDSALFGTERPLFQPYVLAAYDYDINNGWYFEMGIRHEMPIEDTPITLIFQADVGYVQGIQQQFVFVSPSDEGFQHYDLGMTVNYELNTLLNTSRRFGTWTLQGYLFYTDGINADIYADTQLWGGAGIQLRY